MQLWRDTVPGLVVSREGVSPGQNGLPLVAVQDVSGLPCRDFSLSYWFEKLVRLSDLSLEDMFFIWSDTSEQEYPSTPTAITFEENGSISWEHVEDAANDFCRTYALEDYSYGQGMVLRGWSCRTNERLGSPGIDSRFGYLGTEWADFTGCGAGAVAGLSNTAVSLGCMLSPSGTRYLRMFMPDGTRSESATDREYVDIPYDWSVPGDLAVLADSDLQTFRLCQVLPDSLRLLGVLGPLTPPAQLPEINSADIVLGDSQPVAQTWVFLGPGGSVNLQSVNPIIAVLCGRNKDDYSETPVRCNIKVTSYPGKTSGGKGRLTADTGEDTVTIVRGHFSPRLLDSSKGKTGYGAYIPMGGKALKLDLLSSGPIGVELERDSYEVGEGVSFKPSLVRATKTSNGALSIWVDGTLQNTTTATLPKRSSGSDICLIGQVSDPDSRFDFKNTISGFHGKVYSELVDGSVPSGWLYMGDWSDEDGVLVLDGAYAFPGVDSAADGVNLSYMADFGFEVIDWKVYNNPRPRIGDMGFRFGVVLETNKRLDFTVYGAPGRVFAYPTALGYEESVRSGKTLPIDWDNLVDVALEFDSALQTVTIGTASSTVTMPVVDALIVESLGGTPRIGMFFAAALGSTLKGRIKYASSCWGRGFEIVEAFADLKGPQLTALTNTVVHALVVV